MYVHFHLELLSLMMIVLLDLEVIEALPCKCEIDDTIHCKQVEIEVSLEQQWL